MPQNYEAIDGSAVPFRKKALRVFALICVVSAVIGVVWAASRDTNSSSQGGSASAQATQQAAQTCSLVHQGGMQSQILPSGREYMLYVPKTITYPTAVIFAWHGLTEKPQTMEDRLHLMALADSQGFLAVYPQAKNKGAAAAWNGAACCKNDPSFMDVQFAQDILSSLSTPGCVDPARAFSFGFSNGAFLSHRIACEQSEVFAAICPHSGLNGDYSGDLSKSPWTKCDTSGPKKVPVMGVHGTTDKIVPIAGGKNPSSAARWFSFNDTMGIWETRHGCTNPVTEQLKGSDGKTYYKRSFADCSVVSLTVVDLAHSWWVDSTPSCIDFFRQHGL